MMGDEGGFEADTGAALLTDEIRLPGAIADALRVVGHLREQEIPEVKVGQLWRAVWEDVAVLGAILGSDDGYADFAPVTVDIHYADPYTVIVGTADNPLPVSVAVYPSMATPVPEFTLHGCLGEFRDGVVELIDTMWGACRSGRTVLAGSGVSGTDADAIEARRDFRRSVTAQVGSIAAADIGLSDDAGDGEPLPELLKSVGIKPSRLAEILAVPLSDARSIASGVIPLEPDQAVKLSPTVGGKNPDALMRSGQPIPEGLKRALHTPAGFAVVRELARKKKVTFLRAAQEVVGSHAARSSRALEKDASVEYWNGVLRQIRSGEA